MPRSEFNCAYIYPGEAITVSVSDPEEPRPALIELGRRRNARIASIDRRTAGKQGVGHREPTVILQRTEHRVYAHYISVDVVDYPA